jgi:hypothetical protein
MNIVETIINALMSFLSGIGKGVTDVFNRLVYEYTVTAGVDTVLGTIDDVYTKTENMSSLATWGLTFLGISVGVGIFYTLFRIIKK